MSNLPSLFLGICIGFVALALSADAQEADTGRTPAGTIANPDKRLKEADGTEFRFAYYPSLDRVRFLVLTPSPQFEMSSSGNGKGKQ